MIKIFITILLYSFISRGCWGCTTDDIKIITGLSGRQVRGKPEYAVLVYNTCNCPVGGILLYCPEFETVEPVDPAIFVRSTDDLCLFNQGRALQPGTFKGFSYAWDEEFHILARDSHPDC